MKTKRTHYGYPNERDRYFYDFGECSSKNGWVQYDTYQDAWYFGVWVHPGKREILSFAEGDETRTTCENEAEYHAELASMEEFYGPPPPAAIGIDTDTGTVTEFYDIRPV